MQSEDHFWDEPFLKWENPRSPTKISLDVEYEKDLKRFGAAFLGPIFSVFFFRISKRLKSDNNINKLWFLAREGYLLEKSFNAVAQALNFDSIKTGYLFCSRTLLFRLALSNKNLWTKSLEHSYKGSFFNFLKNRYALSKEELKSIYIASSTFRSNSEKNIEIPKDLNLVLSVFEEMPSFFKESMLEKANLYIKYLNQIGFGNNKIEHLIDLGYSGTIQKFLTGLTGISTNGHYFITTRNAENTYNMKFNGYLLESVNFGMGNMLLDRSLFMESILTAPHGQVIDVLKLEDGKIAFNFGVKTPAQKRFHELELICDGATTYAINALKNNNILSYNELVDFYSNFVVNIPSLFPSSISDLFELDDNISGFGFINPITFFHK